MTVPPMLALNENLVLDPSDPAPTLSAIWPKVAAINRQTGGPQAMIRILGIRDVAPVTPQDLAQALCVNVDLEQSGVRSG